MTIYRQAIDSDFEKLFVIWLQGIKSTFKDVTKPDDLKEQFHSVFKERKEHEYWVAELAGEVLGFQSFLPLSKNPLKQEYMVESSTYMNKGFLNKGIGVKLLTYTLSELQKTNIQSVAAFVISTNISVIKLAENLGFNQIGLVPAIEANPEKIIFLKKLR